MGMAVADDEDALRTEYDKVRAFAERMFGDGSVLIERYFPGYATSRCRSSASPTAG
jgi:acetyl-CoA carboxylase biotin carboxylase subunit